MNWDDKDEQIAVVASSLRNFARVLGEDKSVEHPKTWAKIMNGNALILESCIRPVIMPPASEKGCCQRHKYGNQP